MCPLLGWNPLWFDSCKWLPSLHILGCRLWQVQLKLLNRIRIWFGHNQFVNRFSSCKVKRVWRDFFESSFRFVLEVKFFEFMAILGENRPRTRIFFLSKSLVHVSSTCGSNWLKKEKKEMKKKNRFQSFYYYYYCYYYYYYYYYFIFFVIHFFLFLCQVFRSRACSLKTLCK